MFHGIQDWSCIVDIKSHHIILHKDIHTCVFFQRQANLVEGNLVFSSSFNLPRSTQHLCETKFWWSIYWNGPKLVWYCDHWNILEVYQGISCLWSPYFDNPRYIQILCWCFFLDHPRYHVYVIWTKLFLGRLIIMPAMLEYSVTAIALNIMYTPNTIQFVPNFPNSFKQNMFQSHFSTSS